MATASITSIAANRNCHPSAARCCSAGVDVKEGDIITAVNGKPVLEARDIADLLLNQADKQVLLQVKSAKKETRAR
jgi:C-terminal processing protease CtpA/Prc